MAELVYAEFHKILKMYMAERMSDVDVAELLLNGIILSAELSNEKGDALVITKEVMSKVINRNAHIPKKIRTAASLKIVTDDIPGYFKKSVIPRLSKGIESKVVLEITKLIDGDDDVPIDIKKQLKQPADDVALFLSDVLLYTLKIGNKKKKVQEKEHIYKNKPLPERDVPEEISSDELPYVTAILEAYGDKENKPDFDKEDLKDSQYADNFNRHRKSYFNAEYLGRVSRDAYSDEEVQPFDVLKEETYNGVIDAWDMDYPDGYARLNHVMVQASNTRVDSCLLSRETVWINNDVKKGVCHILVNDKKIKGWIK